MSFKIEFLLPITGKRKRLRIMPAVLNLGYIIMATLRPTRANI